MKRYTAADSELLAAVHEAHPTLSGPATLKVLYREFHHYGAQRYAWLASISVAHIYNLRESRAYRERYMCYPKTRAVQVAIGGRRRPDPLGQPGYLRVDTVHQGDLEGSKGLYHIHAVDEVTQWEVVGATAQISETWLIPILEAMLRQFPFRIQGFHSKSRPRHSNDNGLVEAKNGAVIGKLLGYGHIRSEQAEAVQRFYERYFNPYLNFHRPCGVAEMRSNAKGKQRRVCRLVRHAVADFTASPECGGPAQSRPDDCRVG